MSRITAPITAAIFLTFFYGSTFRLYNTIRILINTDHLRPYAFI